MLHSRTLRRAETTTQPVATCTAPRATLSRYCSLSGGRVKKREPPRREVWGALVLSSA